LRICGTIIDADPITGRATSIRRICIKGADLPELEMLGLPTQVEPRPTT
jgi:hypothetical protein